MATPVRKVRPKLLESAFLKGPVELAARLLARRRTGSEDDGLATGIELRRFAGPAIHGEQLTKLMLEFVKS